MGASDQNDDLDSFGTGFKTVNAAFAYAEKEVADKESAMSEPGARFVIVEQKGTSYEIVHIGMVPEAKILWSK